MKKKDYCTWFPESWRGIDISGCCQIHDKACSTTKFYKCLRSKLTIIEAGLITAGGMIGCLVRHTKKTIKRI